MVFAPVVTLSVSLESDGAEVHLHAGGQGFWVAQLMAELGVAVCMATTVGGETGVVLPAVIESAGVGLRAVAMAAPNGITVEQRSGDDPDVLTEIPARPLTRHELDD